MISRAPNGAILDIGPAIERKKLVELNQRLVRAAVERERRRLRFRRRARKVAIAFAVFVVAVVVGGLLF